MAKKKAEDPIVVGLAERMPGILASLKHQVDAAYPPTLRRLAELCDPSASDNQIRKAVGKPGFKAKAVVKFKDRKPDLDAPVYLKGDDGTDSLAAKMLLVLESQRPLGRGAYPPSLRKLAELSGVNGSDARVPKAAVLGPMARRALVAAKAGVKPDLNAPVFLAADLDASPSDLLPPLLLFALTPIPPRRRAKAVETHAFSPDDLAKKLIEPVRKRFADALKAAIERRDLPPGIAWVMVKGKPLLFFLEYLRPGVPHAPQKAESHPTAPAPTSDFSDSFRAAFDRLDRRNGSTNFVKLSDLRRELADFDRQAFDAGLDRLRLEWQFSLNSHEGLLVTLTPEEREAGIREAGSLLVYASRR
jgi:hypothetical protein